MKAHKKQSEIPVAFLCIAQVSSSLKASSIHLDIKMGLSATIHLATALCLSMSAMAVTFAKSPIVETTSGTVRGYYPNASTRAFLGIPYAQPPVGSLRFKSPQPIEQKATEVIDATEFGLSCYQYRANVVGASALSPTTGESEDCLTLNIWGSDTSSGCLRPILVWMYGGAFTEGSSSVPSMLPRILSPAFSFLLM